MLRDRVSRIVHVLLFHGEFCDFLPPIWVQLPCASNGVALWPSSM